MTHQSLVIVVAVAMVLLLQPGYSQTIKCYPIGTVFSQGVYYGPTTSPFKNTCQLTQQSDGNLVLYKYDSTGARTAAWASWTNGRSTGPYQASFYQGLLGFVVRDGRGTAIYSRNIDLYVHALCITSTCGFYTSSKKPADAQKDTKGTYIIDRIA